MSTLTKLVLGAMGALHPRPPVGDAAPRIELPPPDLSDGASLFGALGKRRSSREFRRDALPMVMLSTLLWAADGASSHALQLICAQDVRRVTGYQDFVDDAPLDLGYVADHGRMKAVPVSQREAFSRVAAGAIAQNVYLFAASGGLATVQRAWIDREAIARSLGLSHDQLVLLSQTVGFAKD
jgi:nitroreductase